MASRATLLVFVAALLFHGLIWFQYADNPFMETPISDALSYDRWAQRIAAQGIAAEPVFHQSPLFPLLLGWVYRGASEAGRLTAAIALQVLLNSLAIALLVPLGRLYFRSRGAGIAAACLALLHGPLVFYSMKLLPIPLALVTQIVALALLGHTRTRRAPPPWLVVAVGVTWGIAATARAETLLFQPLVLLAIWCGNADEHEERSVRPRRVVLCAAGTMLAVLPVTLHNFKQGDAVPVASSAGENLFIGNQRGGDGGHTPLHPQAGDLFSQRALAKRIAEEAAGTELRPSEISSYWRGRAVEEVTADPAAWFGLELKKLMRIFHPGDPTDIYCFALERRSFLWGLYLAPVTPWVIWLLASAGLFRSLRPSRRDAWPLAAFAGMHVMVLLIFFVSTRLRLPLLFFLTPFAGLALARMLEGLREGASRLRHATLLIPALLLAVAGFWTYGVTPRETLRLASVLSTQNRLEESLEVLAPLISDSEPDALGLDQAGWVSYKLEDWSGSIAYYRRALELGLPGTRPIQTRTRLAWALEKSGELVAAGEQHDTAAGGAGANAGTFYERGSFRLRLGDRNGARSDFQQSIRLDPGWPPPRDALRRLDEIRP